MKFLRQQHHYFKRKHLRRKGPCIDNLITEDDNNRHPEIYVYDTSIETIHPLKEYGHFVKTNIAAAKGGKSAIKSNNVRSIATMLSWTHYQRYGTNIQALPRTLLSWAKQLFTNHINLIREYCITYLHQQNGLQASTIRKFLYVCLNEFILWFRTIRRNSRNICRINTEDTNRLSELVESLLKLFQRRIRTNKNKHTHDQLVTDRRLPEGDDPVAVLSNIIQQEMKEFDGIIKRHEAGTPVPISKQNYDSYTNLIIACLYLEVPQGRPKALEALRLMDIDQIVRDFGISHEFKTAEQYGIQPILVGNAGR